MENNKQKSKNKATGSTTIKPNVKPSNNLIEKPTTLLGTKQRNRGKTYPSSEPSDSKEGANIQ